MHPARFPFQKPARNSRLNTAHPLARGLIDGFIFNEAQGKIFGYGKHRNSGELKGTASWKTGPYGPYVATSGGASDYIELASRCVPTGGSELTVSTCMKLTFNTDDGNTKILTFSKSSKGWTLRYPGNVRDRFEFYFGNGSSYEYEGYYHGYSDGDWAIISIVLKAEEGNLYWYEEGQLIESDTFSDTTPDWGGRDDPALTNTFFGDDEANAYSDYAWVYIHDRALEADEVKWLHREPYAMFYSPADRARYFTVTAAGTTVPPLAMNSYRQRRV